MTAEKAKRLLAAGRVTPIDGEPRGFTVHGDTGTYRVIVGEHMAWCDCPAGRFRHACSHIDAARLALAEVSA